MGDWNQNKLPWWDKAWKIIVNFSSELSKKDLRGELLTSQLALNEELEIEKLTQMCFKFLFKNLQYLYFNLCYFANKKTKKLY